MAETSEQARIRIGTNTTQDGAEVPLQLVRLNYWHRPYAENTGNWHTYRFGLVTGGLMEVNVDLYVYADHDANRPRPGVRYGIGDSISDVRMRGDVCPCVTNPDALGTLALNLATTFVTFRDLLAPLPDSLGSPES